ncbi:hypothetical protein KJS94_14400 [Flavihumibacter rivuli]|uniref:hypothetical protein n=1 Tax=Flavihumibacter rivuli TaxID=2838156 RepID=UPI001BDF604E|nr:hypothetical protein [Flavihumibacter rivuli]ULQ55837.1 hypothetical protein KJS94_14400 [Flavihumibacter rivuli]
MANGHALFQIKVNSDKHVSGFKLLEFEYNNHFGTAYSLTIDSIGNFNYRPSPEIKMDKKILTRVTGSFSKEGFDKFLNKLTDSLILKLDERRNGCGIDEPQKDLYLNIGNKKIHSKGCSLEPELKLFYEYLDNLPKSEDLINRKRS